MPFVCCLFMRAARLLNDPLYGRTTFLQCSKFGFFLGPASNGIKYNSVGDKNDFRPPPRLLLTDGRTAALCGRVDMTPRANDPLNVFLTYISRKCCNFFFHSFSLSHQTGLLCSFVVLIFTMASSELQITPKKACQSAGLLLLL